MPIDSPKRQSRLPAVIGGLALSISAAAILSSMVSSKPDPETQKPSEETRERIGVALKEEEAVDEPDVTANIQTYLNRLPKSLPKLAGVPELTTREKARNGDLEAAKVLVKTFDKKKGEILNMPDGIIYADVVDDDVVKELGISRKELTLFRNAEDLLFHVSLMDDGKKLKALAHELEEEGAHFISGESQESLLSGLRPRFLMRILCSQSYGPGGEQEQLFLKLTGKTPQQLQDIAHGVYDHFQDPNLRLDKWTIQCLDQIQKEFGFSPAAGEEFDLELRP
jgi:hypothetical protein